MRYFGIRLDIVVYGEELFPTVKRFIVFVLLHSPPLKDSIDNRVHDRQILIH